MLGAGLVFLINFVNYPLQELVCTARTLFFSLFFCLFVRVFVCLADTLCLDPQLSDRVPAAVAHVGCGRTICPLHVHSHSIPATTAKETGSIPPTSTHLPCYCHCPLCSYLILSPPAFSFRLLGACW